MLVEIQAVKMLHWDLSVWYCNPFGSATILSALNSGITDFVMIGNLSRLPQCKILFPMMERLYDVHFIIPKIF